MLGARPVPPAGGPAGAAAGWPGPVGSALPAPGGAAPWGPAAPAGPSPLGGGGLGFAESAGSCVSEGGRAGAGAGRGEGAGRADAALVSRRLGQLLRQLLHPRKGDGKAGDWRDQLRELWAESEAELVQFLESLASLDGLHGLSGAGQAAPHPFHHLERRAQVNRMMGGLEQFGSLEDIRLVLREFCLTSDVRIHSVFAKLGELCRSSGGGADGADGDLAGLAAKIQAGAGRRLSRKRSCSELSRLFADAKARDGSADNHQATPA